MDGRSRPPSINCNSPIARLSPRQNISTYDSNTDLGDMKIKQPLPPITRHHDSQAADATLSPKSPVLRAAVSLNRGGLIDDGFMSVGCQTEWSWLDDMQKYAMHGRRTSSPSTSYLKYGSSRIAGGNSQNFSQSQDSGRDGTPPALDRTLAASAATSRHLSSALTIKSYTSDPYPNKDDEYGIPMLNLDSDLDTTSDDDSVYEFGTEVTPPDQVCTLPSIGPPNILQYHRESEKTFISVDDPESRLVSDEFEIRRRELEESDKALFEGICEFCNSPIKPFPNLDQQRNLPSDDLYCCSSYCEFIQCMLQPPEGVVSKNKLIDIKPHMPYGSKQARKAAKERAAERSKERETARLQAMEARFNHTTTAGRDNPAPGFYQFAKQMKTINFQLSSFKCMEDGWTVRPPVSPDGMPDQEIFEPEPVLPPWAESKNKGSYPGLVRRFYEDGNIFLALFPDGTGNVFYPSGRPAITISSVEQGLFYYIAQKNSDEDLDPLLAVFEPNGFATTYYTNGNLRLHLDPGGGLELDGRGARRRKWSWKDEHQHVHAPPIQPITFSITPHLALRVMDQANIALTFSCKTRRCRFQVGCRLKLVAPDYSMPLVIDEDEVFRNEARNRIRSIMNKVTNLLKFPNCPRLERLSTPHHLTARTEPIHKSLNSKSSKKEKTQIITVS